jgi:enoyl-CoA hydratase/carnithine racemase
MSDEILVARQDGIATITLNRPSQRNAMSHGMWQEVGRVCRELEGDDGVRVVILRGAGDEAFSAGANIKEFEELRSDSAKARRWSQAVEAAIEELAALSKPSIALIKGYCVGGGCELASFADLRIASESARFGVPAARLGISIGYHEMRRLVQLLGPGNTSYLLLSARNLDAQEALRIGLVNQVLPLEEIDVYTMKLAREMAALAPLAHRDNKEILRTVLTDPGLRGLTPGQEALPFRVFDSEDYREGRRAFVEKRRPQFRGR